MSRLQQEQFHQERRDREHALAGRNVVLLALIWAVFAIPDLTTITDLLRLALTLRLAVVTPLILATYPIRRMGRRRKSPLLEELPQAAVGVILATVTATLLIMTRSPHAVPYALTPIVAMTGYSMILRVRLPLAVATLIGICTIGIIGALQASILTRAWVLGIVDISLATLALLLVMVVTREVDLRRTFLLRARLAELTELDQLTGLPNRRALQTRFDQWDAQDRWGVIAMVDVDRFKLFNDVHGHATGDECLRLVARALAQSLRADGAFVARYGGEEFTLVLAGTDVLGGAAVAERLRGAVEATDLDGLQVTISIGWAVSDAEALVSSVDLLSRADEALLTAKAAGRNQAVRWSPPASPATGSARSVALVRHSLHDEQVACPAGPH